MGDASFLQTNFLGGEWSPFAQGRADDDHYRAALNVCLNVLPLEVGAATRRPGTQFCAFTRDGKPAVLRAFHFIQDIPYDAEFTAGFLRIFSGANLLLDNTATAPVSTISSATPAVVQTGTAHNLTTGDQVEFLVTNPTPGESLIFNRQFAITKTGASTYTIADPVTGAGIDGADITYSAGTAVGTRVLTFTTPYQTADLPNIRLVQNEDVAFVLHAGYPPQALTNTVLPGPTQLAEFTWTTPTFLDGPYLDPPTDGSTLTPSATTGTITLTASAITSINGGAGFQSTDVGRMVRLFSQPAAWASGTTYTVGENVTQNDTYWQAVAKNTGVSPVTDDGANWALNPAGAAWTWAIIATVSSTSVVTATLQAADPYGILGGGPLLYELPMLFWQLGVYSDTTVWPEGGVYHEGRFWLFSSILNRVDSTMSNEDYMFAPTLIDGSVADNCGISAVVEGTDRNAIFWAMAHYQGIVLGTQGGEWTLTASNANEPLTPSSIQAHRTTTYGCTDIEPRDTGLSIVFVQRYAISIYEYLIDIWTQKFEGTNIARKAKHITAPGVAEIAYQKETAPILWARTIDGRLLGCTYKRESAMSSQPANFMGWSRHALGSGRTVQCIQVGPSASGNTDSLMLVTEDNDGIFYVEQLTDIPQETDTLLEAWFLDGAVTPEFGNIVAGDLVFYGLQQIIGQTVVAWIGGLNCGSYTVSAQGTISIPLNGSANPFLTEATLPSLGVSKYGYQNTVINTTPVPISNIVHGTVHNFTGTGTPSADTPQESAGIDWPNNLGYFIDLATSAATLYQFNLNTPAVPTASLNISALSYEDSLNCMTTGQDGFFYLYTTGGGLYQFPCAPGAISAPNTLGNSFGTTMGSQLTTLQAGNQTFALMSSIHGVDTTGSSPHLYGMAYFLYNVTSEYSIVGDALVNVPGAVGSSAVQADDGIFNLANQRFIRGPSILVGTEPWGIGYIVERETTVVTQLNIHMVGVNESGTQAGAPVVGILEATAVDAGWTTITVVGGVWDQTDGNLILSVISSSGGASPAYMVKVKPDATVLWKTATHSGPVFSDNSEVLAGQLNVLDPSAITSGVYRYYTFNTATGAQTHVDESTSALLNQDQYTSDRTGQVIFFQGIEHFAWATFGPSGEYTPALSISAPAVIGFDYNSDGQLLRTLAPQEAGAQNGPALGKTRRLHQFAAFLANAQNVQFGTDFLHLLGPAALQSYGGTPTPLNELFTGVWWDQVDDEYSYDGMWCWRVNGGYPCTVVAVEGFLQTQDR